MPETIDEILARSNGVPVQRRGDASESIRRIFDEEGANSSLGLAMARQEGGKWDTRTSGAGAQGPLQVIPATGLRYVKPDEWATPEGKIRASARYIKDLSAQFGDDPYYVTAAYHAGEGKVKPYYDQGREIPRAPEFYDKHAGIYTPDHVNRVINNLQQGKKTVYGGNTIDDILARTPSAPPDGTPSAPSVTSSTPPPKTYAPGLGPWPEKDAKGKPYKPLTPEMEAWQAEGRANTDREMALRDVAVGHKQDPFEGVAVGHNQNYVPPPATPATWLETGKATLKEGGARLLRTFGNLAIPSDIPYDRMTPAEKLVRDKQRNYGQESQAVYQRSSLPQKITQKVGSGVIGAVPPVVATMAGVPAPLAFGANTTAENLDLGAERAVTEGLKAGLTVGLMQKAQPLITPLSEGIKASIASRLVAGGLVGTGAAAMQVVDDVFSTGQPDYERAAHYGIPAAIITALLPGAGGQVRTGEYVGNVNDGAPPSTAMTRSNVVEEGYQGAPGAPLRRGNFLPPGIRPQGVSPFEPPLAEPPTPRPPVAPSPGSPSGPRLLPPGGGAPRPAIEPTAPAAELPSNPLWAGDEVGINGTTVKITSADSMVVRGIDTVSGQPRFWPKQVFEKLAGRPVAATTEVNISQPTAQGGSDLSVPAQPAAPKPMDVITERMQQAQNVGMPEQVTPAAPIARVNSEVNPEIPPNSVNLRNNIPRNSQTDAQPPSDQPNVTSLLPPVGRVGARPPAASVPPVAPSAPPVKPQIIPPFAPSSNTAPQQENKPYVTKAKLPENRGIQEDKNAQPTTPAPVSAAPPLDARGNQTAPAPTIHDILHPTAEQPAISPAPAKRGEEKRGETAGAAPDHESSSTQVNLPKPVADKITSFGQRIPESDLASDGREDQPHVTVKFGLHGNTPDEVRALLANEKPIKVKFGKVSLFENDEHDVVKVDVDSPDLHRLNKKIADALPNTDTHPTYKPHATIAYVKKGKGKKYAGSDALAGQEMTINSIVFSDKKRNQVEIPLGGGQSASPTIEDILNPQSGVSQKHTDNIPQNIVPVSTAPSSAKESDLTDAGWTKKDLATYTHADGRALRREGGKWVLSGEKMRGGKLRKPKKYATLKDAIADLAPSAKPAQAAPQAESPIQPAKTVTLAELPQVKEPPSSEPAPKPALPKEIAPAKAAPSSLVAKHADLFERVEKGKATAAEFKAAFDELIASKDAIKAELSALTKDAIFDKFPGLRWRYKSDKKDRVVSAAYDDMLGDFSLGGSISYVMGQGSYEQSVRNLVAKVTDESLAAYAEKIKKARAERDESRKAALEGMKDPQTLDDYVRLLKSKMAEGASYQDARLALTPEQRATFDELAGAKSRDERRARADQQRTEVRAASQATTGQVIETKHTKTGEPLFVVKAADRVERDVYNQWNATAKRLGGWYSSFRGAGAVPGFQFKTREAAEAFLEYLGGKVERVQETAQARRDAMQDDKSQTAVERLREMADSLDEHANEVLSAERQTNTERRARFAANAEAAANSDKAMAATMRNIAEAIESGKAKFLDRVRQKVQVEMLQTFARSGYDDYLRAKYPTYGEQEKHRAASPPIEAADYVQFPAYTAFRSDLAKLGRQLSENDGTKKLGASILKVADDVTDAYLKFAKENLHKVSTFSRKDGKPAVFASKPQAETAIARSGYKGQAIVLPFKRGENIITLSPSAAREKGIWEGDNDARITLSPEIGDELVEKLKRQRRREFDIPWIFETASERRKRLAAMGLETPAELRAAVREFIGLRKAPKAPDKIKEMERAMVGRRNDGLDFFPTPAGVAGEMIATADIQEGMSVLEPSAGMGHIADRIREAGFQPDVMEFSSDRRDLLKAKGYYVVGSDFMDLTPRGFTYGDVFKYKDGRTGIMRGSGGMGSSRVGFIPEGKDARQSEWVDREDLTGVRKVGHNSGYDRILMNPPFSDRRDVEHVRHAYDLLKPGGRLVAIMGEGSFFGSDKKATAFREWLEKVGGTSEKLEEGTFLDPSLPVNTGVSARMVVIDKPEAEKTESTTSPAAQKTIAPAVEARTMPKEETNEPNAKTTETAQPAEASRGSILEPVKASGRAARGAESTLSIPRTNQKLAIRYEVRELGDIQPSHNPFSFEKNPDYRLSNDRDYTSPANRMDVEEASKAGVFEPRLLLTDDPTATNGPPVIYEGGDVLGGNSRTMMLARVYRNHPIEAQKYRAGIVGRAAMFGIDPQALKRFDQPVLVRVIDAKPESLQKLITDLNVQPGKAMTATETAAARAKSLPPQTMQFIADRLNLEGPDGTLAEALTGAKGVVILNRLITDEVIPSGERNRYLTEQGVLTPQAKAEIEGMLLGRLFEDADQMKATPPTIKNKLARVAPQLAKVAGTGWDITNLLPKAIRAVSAAKNSQVELEMLNRRGSLFGDMEQYTPEELAIARAIENLGPRQIANKFGQYVTGFEESNKGYGLFGSPPSSKEVFDDVFQPAREDGPEFSLRQDAAPVFFSQLERTIEQKMPAKASGRQVRAILQSPQNGVKPDEVKWSGLDDYLNTVESLTKEDVLKWLRANRVDVQEVEKGRPELSRKRRDEMQVEANIAHARGDYERSRQIYSQINKLTPQETKFSEYVLPGAKEGSYRELLLTLPAKEAQSKADQFQQMRQARLRGDDIEAERLSYAVAQPETQTYRSSHFDEPNILAHIRFNERTDSGGKRVLHIEEIQSDWHQDGRKKGYKADNESGVPDAPFKKTWHELAFKRALRYAAENGYDKMTWTTGEQQAERFDLSKQVDEITYGRVGDKYWVGVSKDGREITRKHGMTLNDVEDFIGKEMAQKIERGEGESTKGSDRIRTLTGDNLKIGGEGMKGFYDQILPAFASKYAKKWGAKVESAELGRSLNVIKSNIGDGYEVFENGKPAILELFQTRQEAQEAARKLGQGQSVHSISITPAMRESVMQGQPQFAKAAAPKGWEEAGGLVQPERVAHRWNAAPINEQTATMDQLLDGMRSRIVPPTRDRHLPMLHGNRATTVILSQAMTEMYGRHLDIKGVNLAHVHAAELSRRLTMIAQLLASRKDAQRASNIYELIGRIQLAQKKATALGYDSIQYVDADDTRSDDLVARTEQHETAHAEQRKIGGQAQIVSDEWAKNDKDFQQLSKALSTYGGSPRDVAVEAIAHILSGDRELMGYTGARGLDRANDFVDRYMAEVAHQHGVWAVKQFRYIRPEFRKTIKEVAERHEQRGQRENGEYGNGRDSTMGNSLRPATAQREGITGPIQSVQGIRGQDSGTRPLSQEGSRSVGGRLPEGGPTSSQGSDQTALARRGETLPDFSRRDFWGVGEARSALETFGKWSRESLRDIRSVVNPMGRGLSGEQTASITRERAAEMARKGDQADEKLKDARRILGKLPEMNRRAFVYAIETGTTDQLPAQFQPFAATTRELLDGRRDEVQSLGTGKLQSFYENYFPHIWKDPEKANQVFMSYFAKRPFEGSKSFLKQRTIPTIEHGIALGLEPVSTNPVDLVMLKLREMDRYIMAHRIMDEMKDKGLLTRIKATHRVPPGYAKLDDKVSTIYGEPTEKGTIKIRGYWIAPEPAANVLNNYLSPGLRKYALFRGYLTLANVMNQAQLGISGFHFGFTSLDAAISKVALALQQSSYGRPLQSARSVAEAAISPVTNILKGRHVYKAWVEPGSMGPEWDAIANAVQAGGGRVRQDQLYATQMTKKMVEAFRKKNLPGGAEGLFRLPFAALEQMSRPLMEYLVPRQKLGVFSDLARVELERLGPNATREDVRKTMAKVWDSVDNRMGQLVYDNLFWDKTFKDVLMASVRSVGWNLGTKREVIGGAADFVKFGTNVLARIGGRGGGKIPPGGTPPTSYRSGGDWFSGKPEFTYRMGYVIALPIVVGLVGAMINYLMTGERPKDLEDCYFPRTGSFDENGKPNRISLPSYMKDIYHYAVDPKKTVVNKLHPALNTVAETLSNKDFYGTEVYNPDDPPYEKAKDVLKHIGASFEPFAIRGLREDKARQTGAPDWFPFIGLTPAPKSLNQSKAERLMDELNAEHRPMGSRTKEQAAQGRLKADIVRTIRRGGEEEGRKMAQDAIDAGKLSGAQLPLIERRAHTPGIVWSFTSLSLSDSLKVWDVATEEEKQALRPALQKKMQSLGRMPEEERNRLLPKARAALGNAQ